MAAKEKNSRLATSGKPVAKCAHALPLGDRLALAERHGIGESFATDSKARCHVIAASAVIFTSQLDRQLAAFLGRPNRPTPPAAGAFSICGGRSMKTSLRFEPAANVKSLESRAAAART